MATNKRPRHKRRVKGSRSVLVFDRRIIAAMKDFLTTLRIAVQMKLPKGDLNTEELRSVRDVFMIGQCAALTRTWLDDTYREALKEQCESASRLIVTLMRRAYKIDRFVCKGEELQDLLLWFDNAAELIQYSLDNGEVNQLCKEIMATDDLLSHSDVPRSELVAYMLTIIYPVMKPAQPT